MKEIEKAANLIRESYQEGGKVLIFGNGGSAAEAQHFAAELVGRFERDRRALPAIALTTDTSIITAQANDDSFRTIFSRQIEALGKKGDVAIGLTTSDAQEGDDHSANILDAFKVSKAAELKTIGFFSNKTTKLLDLADAAIVAPHTQTALIQEVQLSAIHLVCRMVEKDI